MVTSVRCVATLALLLGALLHLNHAVSLNVCSISVSSFLLCDVWPHAVALLLAATVRCFIARIFTESAISVHRAIVPFVQRLPTAALHFRQTRCIAASHQVVSLRGADILTLMCPLRSHRACSDRKGGHITVQFRNVHRPIECVSVPYVLHVLEHSVRSQELYSFEQHRVRTV